MKLLTIVLLASLPLTPVFAEKLTCGSTKAEHKRTYPINAAAINLAAKLGIKTCTGTSSKRFARAVKRLKHKVQFVVVTSAQLEKAQLKRIGKGGKGGPSLNY